MLKKLMKNLLVKFMIIKEADASLNIVNFVKKRNVKLRKSTEYRVTIADSCVVCNKIKILFELCDKATNEVHHIHEEFTVDDKAYIEFINFVYCGDDSDVIAVDLRDFDNFLAYGYGSCVQDGHIKWRELELFESPLSATYHRREQVRRRVAQ